MKGPGSCWLLVGLVLFLAAPFSSIAAQEFTLGQKGDKPTEITARKLIYNQAAQQVEFVGDVHVIRPDFELWCKSMSVFLNEKRQDRTKGRKNPGIKRIVARDEVRTKMNGRESESDKATYQAGSEVITLEGNVLITEGQNRLKGEQVVLYLNENRTEVFSSKEGKVSAVFYPSKDSE